MMSRKYVPASLRRRVAARARGRCGYCLSDETSVGMTFEIEHIIPQVAGGRTVEENLWLSCPDCNSYKATRASATDPLTGELVPLFDPRRQPWHEHFAWTDGGVRIEGLTPVGRATVEALRLNRPVLTRARQVWIIAGVHPPDA